MKPVLVRGIRTIVVVITATIMGYLLRYFTESEVFIRLISPDQKYEAVLTSNKKIQDPHLILLLRNRSTGLVRKVFETPDEGAPVGTERLIWNRNGKWLLLVGREFYVNDEAVLPSGELLYLLYNVETRELLCNSNQQNDYKPFGIEELNGLGFMYLH